MGEKLSMIGKRVVFSASELQLSFITKMLQTRQVQEGCVTKKYKVLK
jgi:hypothetical protein